MRLTVSWMLVAVTNAAVMFAVLNWWKEDREYLLWCLGKSHSYAEGMSARCERAKIEIQTLQLEVERLKKQLNAMSIHRP